jgi:hypothetical protein
MSSIFENPIKRPTVEAGISEGTQPRYEFSDPVIVVETLSAPHFPANVVARGITKMRGDNRALATKIIVILAKKNSVGPGITLQVLCARRAVWIAVK